MDVLHGQIGGKLTTGSLGVLVAQQINNPADVPTVCKARIEMLLET